MTDEERQRAMDFIVAQQAKNSAEIEKLLESQQHRDSIASRQSNEKATEARRKLDRDMDRLERVLKRALEPNPQARQRKHHKDKRWREFEKHAKKHFAEISTFAAVSDQKLKALSDQIRNDRAKRQS